MVRPADAPLGVSPPGRHPFCAHKKDAKKRLGRKRGFDYERKGRVLAHSVFPLRTPFLRESNQEVQRSIDRRGVSRHAKPLIPAAAPMELVTACRAIGRRLHCKFACCCVSAAERISHKSPPEQRQRKEKYCVLVKEFPIVRGRRPKAFDAPLWRIFFGGSTPFLLYANKRNGVEKKRFSSLRKKKSGGRGSRPCESQRACPFIKKAHVRRHGLSERQNYSRPNFLLKRLTRPPVSTIFCLPV